MSSDKVFRSVGLGQDLEPWAPVPEALSSRGGLDVLEAPPAALRVVRPAFGGAEAEFLRVRAASLFVELLALPKLELGKVGPYVEVRIDVSHG